LLLVSPVHVIGTRALTGPKSSPFSMIRAPMTYNITGRKNPYSMACAHRSIFRSSHVLTFGSNTRGRKISRFVYKI